MKVGRSSAFVLTAALAAGLSGCEAESVPAAVLGQRQLSNPGVSSSPLNHFSCSTCHQASAAALADGAAPTGLINSGYDLFDTVHRPSWWGGYEVGLLDAMNYCLSEFMGGAPWSDDATPAREIYEYLAAQSPDDPAPALPLTVIENVTALSNITGDATRGQDVYGRACHICHGEPHTGAGRIDPRASTIPEDTLAVFPTNARAVLVEKVRHGRFFNIGGIMPLYSAEAISDQQIADIAAYLGL